MAKPRPVIAITVAALILAVAVLNWLSQQQPQEENSYLPSQYTTVTLLTADGKPLAINAEVAGTDEKRTTGLMFRESLGENEGMLFVFPDSATRSFWMKNTLIPLDIIFIAENMTIVKVYHATPCSSDPCRLYSSEKPVKYVLEVNANLTANYGIGEGSSAGFK